MKLIGGKESAKAKSGEEKPEIDDRHEAFKLKK